MAGERIIRPEGFLPPLRAESFPDMVGASIMEMRLAASRKGKVADGDVYYLLNNNAPFSIEVEDRAGRPTNALVLPSAQVPFLKGATYTEDAVAGFFFLGKNTGTTWAPHIHPGDGSDRVVEMIKRAAEAQKGLLDPILVVTHTHGLAEGWRETDFVLYED